jgi:hypothetical protein
MHINFLIKRPSKQADLKGFFIRELAYSAMSII